MVSLDRAQEYLQTLLPTCLLLATAPCHSFRRHPFWWEEAATPTACCARCATSIFFLLSGSHAMMRRDVSILLYLTSIVPHLCAKSCSNSRPCLQCIPMLILTFATLQQGAAPSPLLAAESGLNTMIEGGRDKRTTARLQKTQGMAMKESASQAALQDCYGRVREIGHKLGLPPSLQVSALTTALWSHPMLVLVMRR